MLIRTEEDFLKNQRWMHETLLTILKIGIEMRGKDLVKRSVIENWIGIADIIRNKRDFPEGISKITLPTLCAYYLSQKLKDTLPVDSRRTQYEFFQEANTILSKFSSENYDILKKELCEHLHGIYLEIPMEKISNLINTIIPGIKLLQEIYVPIKGWVRSVKSWEPPNQEKGLPEEHLCDYLEESIAVRSMAHVLEHIIKESRRKFGAQNPITIEDIQNELVHTGLNFGEKSHPHFAWGSMFALPQLFDFEKEHVLAWYLVDKIAKSLQCKVFAEMETVPQEQIQDLLVLIKQDFNKLNAIISTHRDNLQNNPQFFKECSRFLKSIMKKRGFNEKQIFIWTRGLRDLLTVYDIYEKHLKNKTHLEQNRSEEPLLKLLVVGDSVSAGLRVPHNKKDERWVAQLQRMLTEAGLPVKVINCSVSASETSEGLEALPQYLKFFNPDMVVCPLGGNDARKGRDLFQVLDNMEAFVKICKEHGIRSERIIWGAGIPKTFEVCEGYRNTFLGALREFEKRTGAVGAPLPDHILAEKYIDEDRLHFRTEIQKDIADFAYNTVVPIARVLWSEKKHRLEVKETQDNLADIPFLPRYYSKMPQRLVPVVLEQQAKVFPHQHYR